MEFYLSLSNLAVMSELRKVVTLLMLCCAFVSLPTFLNAQFSITPTDSLYTTVPADSVISIHTIDFPVETVDSLQLTWRLIEEEVTEGWVYDLCDLGTCYDGVPGTADMLPAAPGASGFLKMLVNPNGHEGRGFWHFWVYPTEDPDNFVNIYFDIIADADVSVDEIESEAWVFGPNPAEHTLYIYGKEIPSRVQLFSTSGGLTYDLNTLTLDVSGVTPGLYIIRISDAAGTKTLTDKVLIK